MSIYVFWLAVCALGAGMAYDRGAFGLMFSAITIFAVLLGSAMFQYLEPDEQEKHFHQ